MPQWWAGQSALGEQHQLPKKCRRIVFLGLRLVVRKGFRRDTLNSLVFNAEFFVLQWLRGIPSEAEARNT